MRQSTSPTADRQRYGSKEEFWRDALRRFAESGQDVRGFCAARGLSKQSFYSWRRRLAGQDRESALATGGPPAPAFVPVHVAPENGPGMEIVLRGDRRIRLCGPVDRPALAEAVAALESLPVQDSAR
jgi:hypothetical protein